jgi:hypothetical protein
MANIRCSEMLETNYQSIQRNIPDNRRPPPDAASIEERLLRLNFDSLHLTYISQSVGRSVYLCHQQYICITGKAVVGTYRKE